MNKEEIDNWLDEEYGCSYTRLEELHDFYFEKYIDLREENKQLKDVIEEIRKRLKFERKIALSLNQAYTVSVIDIVLQILDKGESDE